VIGPEDLRDSLLELSSLLLGEETLHSVLERIVELACAAIPGCTHCGVSLLSDERVTTAAAGDGTTLQLDGAQYTTGEGPCLQAARTGTIVRVDDLAYDGRFPLFALEAVRLGINSTLSLTLTVKGVSIGGLNIYGEALKAFDEVSERLGLRFARQASANVWPTSRSMTARSSSSRSSTRRSARAA
jgi:GAF domain-containing protein